MNWEKLASLLALEADRVGKETFPEVKSERSRSVATAGLSAIYVLNGLAKCISQAIEVDNGR